MVGGIGDHRYHLSAGVDITFLLSFAAGNFIYIAASDLIPEVKHDLVLRNNLIHFGAFVAGMLLILVTRFVFERHSLSFVIAGGGVL